MRGSDGVEQRGKGPEMDRDRAATSDQASHVIERGRALCLDPLKGRPAIEGRVRECHRSAGGRRHRIVVDDDRIPISEQPMGHGGANVAQAPNKDERKRHRLRGGTGCRALNTRSADAINTHPSTSLTALAGT